MLSESEKARLNKAFDKEGLTELTLQQAEKIAKQTNIPLIAIESFALEKGISPPRYQRNIGSLGIAGQRKLLDKKVIVVGLGGLGGYVLEQLARMGLAQIVAVDPDIFDEANLNRQLLADEKNLGEKKVTAAENRLRKVNRAVEFAGYAVPLDRLPDEIWRDADLVFDCLDNIKDRLTLARRCSVANVPLVHGAIAGWYGQVGVVWPDSGMLEKVYEDCSRGVEQDVGIPPFTAAVAASLMVAEGIKILVGSSSGKQPKMLFFDLQESEWQTLSF